MQFVAVGGLVWRIGREKWCSRHDRPGMAAAEASAKLKAVNSNQDSRYNSVLSVEEAKFGHMTPRSFEKHTNSGLSDTHYPKCFLNNLNPDLKGSRFGLPGQPLRRIFGRAENSP